jgi:hypothetical protein
MVGVEGEKKGRGEGIEGTSVEERRQSQNKYIEDMTVA